MAEATAEQLGRIERKLDELLRAAHLIRRANKPAFTTVEAAELLGKAPLTVRRWCQNGRLAARKRAGRGNHDEWEIAREEIERYRAEGLLPAAGECR
jgi:predicted transcriptional regulator